MQGPVFMAAAPAWPNVAPARLRARAGSDRVGSGMAIIIRSGRLRVAARQLDGPWSNAHAPKYLCAQNMKSGEGRPVCPLVSCVVHFAIAAPPPV